MLEGIQGYTRGWLAKLILLLIIVPFALWGIESYISHGGSATVYAQVGNARITEQEFNRFFQQQQDSLRRSLGADYDPALMAGAQAKQMLLNELVNRQLLLNAARDAGYGVSDEDLAKLIALVPGFQADGKFSQEKYKIVLRSQDLTPALFESLLREDLLIQNVRTGYSDAAIVPETALHNLLTLSAQNREVSEAALDIQTFLDKVDLGESSIRRYYDEHLIEFRIPQQIRVEYTVLSSEQLMREIQVSEKDIKKYQAEHVRQDSGNEERRASHILFAVPPQADAATRQSIRDKALAVLQQVRVHPGNFSAMARRYSQDPGSAAQGGDLGFFKHGMMIAEFENAVFAMSAGQISELVETKYGFHIIKLTAIRSSTKTDLDQVHSRLVTELKKERAAKRFAEQAETFSNMVYEQSDSLMPVARELGLALQTSGWLDQRGSAVPFLNNAKLLEALFSDGGIGQRRNTEVIEVMPGILVSARVVDHKPEAVKPFAEVRAQLADRLRRQEALRLLVANGKSILSKLKQGGQPENLDWSKPVMISRKEPAGLNVDALDQVFSADTAKLPAYAGIETKEGYSLFKISKVSTPESVDELTARSFKVRLEKASGAEDFSAFLEGLKKIYPVHVNRDRFESTAP